MSDFLDTMKRASRVRVLEASRALPVGLLRMRALDTPEPPALRFDDTRFDLIAEIKRRSPSAGELSGPLAIAARATEYARGGAAAVSVLTEPSRFGGELSHLASAAVALALHGVPAMRKDFLIDPYQVYEARAAGAGGVLLILRMLDDAELRALLDAAAECALFVLLEAFDAADLERARSLVLDASVVVGVNARDLATLAVETVRFELLRDAFPRGVRRVAESGIDDADGAARVAALGYDLALAGTALMRARDPAALIGEMLRAGRARGHESAATEHCASTPWRQRSRTRRWKRLPAASAGRSARTHFREDLRAHDGGRRQRRRRGRRRCGQGSCSRNRRGA
jgi:indole-3-glycerol phosphate synthase